LLCQGKQLFSGVCAFQILPVAQMMPDIVHLEAKAKKHPTVDGRNLASVFKGIYKDL